MKKLRILCAAALICLAPGMALAADNAAATPPLDAPAAGDVEAGFEKPYSAFAEVQEKGEDYLLLKLEANEMNLEQLRVNIGDDSLLVDNETGKDVALADIKVGQRVFAYCGRAMTRSIPPQSHLELLLTNVDKKTPASLWQVEGWDAATDGMIDVTVDNGGLILHITENAWGKDGVPGNLQRGERILAWYDVVLTSYPGQAGPERVMRLDSADVQQPSAILAKTALAEVISVEAGGDYDNIMVKVDNDEIQLNVAPDFKAVSAKTGKTVEWQGLKPGDKVLANYGPQMTFSIPPQSPLNYLVVDFGDNPPAGLFRAEQVVVDDDGNCRILTDNGGLWLTVPKAAWAEKAPQNVETLLAWYDVVAESYPAQATATKAVALTKRAAVPAKLTAGNLLLPKAIEQAHGQLYVPLRAVAEALGFKVDWSDAEQSAHLSNGVVQTTVYINQDSYYTATAVTDMVGMSAPQSFGAAPYLRQLGGEPKTYVPAKLFELLGFAVETDDDNNLLNISAK